MATAPTLTGKESDAKEAALFLQDVITAVATQSREAPVTDSPRLFFPEGIDLISLSFKIGTSVAIVLTVSGKSCCKSAATGPDADEEPGARAEEETGSDAEAPSP